MRCGIYTRFSSDHQHPASLEDQQLMCERYANHQGWKILTEHIYSDAALSGMGVQHRPAYQQLLTALARVPAPFEVLLVDDLSRLSRDAAEILRVVRLLQEMGLKLISVADGIETGTKLSKLALSVKAIINECFLDDLRDRTLRGLQGRFVRGLHTGGRIYGYRSVPVYDPAGRTDAAGHPLTLGAQLTVDPRQAEIVRQIFAWFIQGLGLRTIADRLNTQTIPFPAQATQRGGKRKGWASSAVRVILKNEKYRGRWVWGRRLFFKDPLTGRRRARLRPSSDWQVAEHADLRIVSEDLWARVDARFQKLEMIYAPRHAHGRLNGRQRGSPSRRAALFSGLLTCQVCGGGLVVVSGNLQRQNGRYGCGFHRNKGPRVCGNGLTVKVTIVERRLVEAIRTQVLSPESLSYLVQVVNTRLQALSSEQDGTQQRLTRELQQVENELQHIERAIVAGLIGETTASLLKDREARRNVLRQQLQGLQHPHVRPEHPVTLNSIRTRVEDLYGLLSGDSVQVNAFFREHLTSIVCSPIQDRGQLFYRASGAVKSTALMVTLGLVQEYDFGGCGGRI
jgi:site-specific DNA recombinase